MTTVTPNEKAQTRTIVTMSVQPPCGAVIGSEVGEERREGKEISIRGRRDERQFRQRSTTHFCLEHQTTIRKHRRMKIEYRRHRRLQPIAKMGELDQILHLLDE